MNFATFKAGGQLLYGACKDGGVVELSSRFPQWSSLKNVVEHSGFHDLQSAAEDAAVTHADGTFEYALPIPDPEKIICVGVNFPDRNAEYKDGQVAPDNPSLFIRFPRSFTGHQQALIRPQASEKLDYEGEIVVVIGKGGRHISQADAMSHIAALSLCNEGTLRDWVRHAKFNVTQGKNFDGSGAMGPYLVPFVDPKQLEDIELRTTVNGEVRQQDRTSRMLFSFAKQIEYISTFTTLVPGDVIVTGTPTGAGARQDPPVFLKPGDVIEVEAEGIGMLRNTVEDEV